MEVKIEKLDNFGNGITHINDKIIFVKRALPNELVDIEIYKEKKDIAFANIVKVIEPSKERRESVCPFYSKCGGCNFLHTTEAIEKEFKINKAKELLKTFNEETKSKRLKGVNINQSKYQDLKAILELSEEVRIGCDCPSSYWMGGDYWLTQIDAQLKTCTIFHMME